MGGFFWAYMGPGEPPVLPRYDYFVQPNTLREIGKTKLPINWLQAMENSLDPIHSEWLHSWFTHYQRSGQTKKADGSFPQERTAKIGFDVFEYGIVKRRIYEGGTEEDNDWKIGHPGLFPNILKTGAALQIRVPIDDENMMHYLYSVTTYEGIEVPHQEVVPVYDYPYLKEDGDFAVDWVLQQDMMAWVTQGTIADRTIEHLRASDLGIILYRKVLDEMIACVEAGGDPIGVFRDRENTPINIVIDATTKPLTPTSTRAVGRFGVLTHRAERNLGAQVDSSKRSNGEVLSPLLEEKIHMRLKYHQLQESMSLAENDS
jgi:5,5'-dehydrodivanillate O-demethylase